MGLSATITPAIHPMSTSQALADPSRAGLWPTVSNKLHQPLTCSALHLQPPCRWPDGLPSPASPQLLRHRALRLLRLRLQTPVPSRTRLRAA